jgi:hypothetical protein
MRFGKHGGASGYERILQAGSRVLVVDLFRVVVRVGSLSQMVIQIYGHHPLLYLLGMDSRHNFCDTEEEI